MKQFLLAVDSDGCAFDTMEVKHRRCFAPRFAEFFAQQSRSRIAEEVWNFINLSSAERGINRYRGLLRALDELATHPEGGSVAPMPALRRWTEETRSLSATALAEAIAAADGDGSGAPADAAVSTELRRVAEWSRAVDASFQPLVDSVPSFPGVREALAAAAEVAEIVVVSSAPTEVLLRQWRRAGLDTLVAEIAGQEEGSKAAQLARAREQRGLDPGRILVIGDAPGDARAAQAAAARFFPINPGHEGESWATLLTQGLPRFTTDRWDPEYQEQLLAAFEGGLPAQPPWATTTRGR